MELTNNHKPIQACIFDMDGLLIDSERPLRDVYQAVAEQLGFPITNDIYLLCVGRNEPDTRAIIKEHVSRDFPFEQIAELARARLSTLLADTGWPLKPGATVALERVIEIGLRRCVATSTARALAENRLVSAKIRHYFESITCGDEVTRGKPAPDIFLLAAKRLELPPERCIVLEDSEYGARAALEAGMRCVMVPDLKTPPESLRPQIDGIFDDLVGAVTYIQGISRA
jgi:HAD superfamily hydrolase (TIGR01509 family)